MGLPPTKLELEAADEIERLRAALTKIELLVVMSEKLDTIHDKIRAVRMVMCKARISSCPR
jgi:hypothetical protein